MKIRNKFIFLVLILLLNILLRIPSAPHEMGADSFIQHILANSLSENGYARWWINIFSVFGLYPYSSPSAVAFSLSAISQTSNVQTEVVIWLYSVIIGILGCLAVYVLSGKIKNNEEFKILLTFIYSISPGVLKYTTWEISTRGPFVALLPLFLVILLKNMPGISGYIRKYLILILLFILLLSTHHLVYFISIIILSYVISKILYNKFIEFINKRGIIILFVFCYSFVIPFFTYLFIAHSRYEQFYVILRSYLRYVGLLLFFVPAGYVYLSLKNNKNFGEILILIAIILIAPFMWIQVYSYWVANIFLTVVIAFALFNILKKLEDKGPINNTRKAACVVLILSLILATSFSGFYQHWRTYIGKSPKTEWYTDEKTYEAAIWAKEYIDKTKRIVGNDDWITRRISAYSSVPALIDYADVVVYTYGFVDISTTPIKRNSPLSISFYIDNPYVIPSNFTRAGYYRSGLQLVEVDSYRAQSIISKFNLSYMIENRKIINVLTISVHKTKNCLYDNGKIRIWNLK